MLNTLINPSRLHELICEADKQPYTCSSGGREQAQTGLLSEGVLGKRPTANAELSVVMHAGPVTHEHVESMLEEQHMAAVIEPIRRLPPCQLRLLQLVQSQNEKGKRRGNVQTRSCLPSCWLLCYPLLPCMAKASWFTFYGKQGGYTKQRHCPYMCVLNVCRCSVDLLV